MLRHKAELECWHVHCTRVWHQLKMAPVLCVGKYWGYGPGTLALAMAAPQRPGQRTQPSPPQQSVPHSLIQATSCKSHEDSPRTFGHRIIGLNKDLFKNKTYIWYEYTNKPEFEVFKSTLRSCLRRRGGTTSLVCPLVNISVASSHDNTARVHISPQDMGHTLLDTDTE